MAVFRIERTRDYTVMSNHHLRNANLIVHSKLPSAEQFERWVFDQ